MNMKSEELRVELIASEEAFLALKDEWDALIDKSINPSFYATYPFVYTTWKYFRSENDQLFILLVRRGATLVGIAPFRIENMKAGNIRLLKVIRFIAEWGSGDKPSIVMTEEPERLYDRIFQYLNKEYTHWDMIHLPSQPANSPILNQKLLGNIWYSTRVVPDFTSFYASIIGTWEEYLKTRGKNTRKKWNKSRKKLFDLPEGVICQCLEDPETMQDALKRFIEIEQSGWKNNRDFSVGGSEKKIRFYEEMLIQLAHKNMAAIYLLTSGTTDIAGALIYKCKSTVYGAQITFRPTYAEYSPGVILNAEIIKTMFGTQYREFDFLGFQGDEKNPFKKNWSSGTLQTITIQVYKKSLCMYLCMFLYISRNRLINLRRKAIANMTEHQPSKQAQVTEQ